MAKLFIFNIFLYIGVLLLSLLIILISKKGYLSLRLKIFCRSNSTEEFLILLFILSGILMFILYLLFALLTPFFYELFNNKSGLVWMVNENNNQDPVRWRPSGTPQSWGILGTALGIYRLVPGSPRVKAISALGSLGITIPSTVYFHAVENPNGFNRLMYSWMKYKQTGNWPINIPNLVQDTEISEIIPNIVSEAEGKYEILKNSTSSSSFLPNDLNSFLGNFIRDSFSFLLDIFRPVPVVGYLDDLIGQQLFILFLLFIIVVSLIVILTVYLFIIIMVNNKEYLLSKFNNKFILYFVKYQYFLAKSSYFILPLFLMFGLIELLIGLYFLLTHPIPYDKLDLDLHNFISQSLTWNIKLLNDPLDSPNNLGNDSVNVKSGSIVPIFRKILKSRIIRYILYSILLVNVYIFYPRLALAWRLVGYINYNFCLYFIFIFTLFIFYNIFNIILYIYIMDFKGSIKDHKILNKLPKFLLEKYLVFNNSKSKDFLISHFFKLLIFYILMLLILIIISLILVYF